MAFRAEMHFTKHKNTRQANQTAYNDQHYYYLSKTGNFNRQLYTIHKIPITKLKQKKKKSYHIPFFLTKARIGSQLNSSASHPNMQIKGNRHACCF